MKILDKQIRDTLVKTLIEPAAATVGERFKDRPLTEAAVRATLASTLYALDRYDLALPQAKRALDLHRKMLREDHPDTIQSMITYSLTLSQLGRAQEAEPLSKKALELRRKSLGENHPDTIDALSDYGLVLFLARDVQAAEPLIKRAFEQRRKMLGEVHPDTIESLGYYATLLHWQGRQSEQLNKQVLELFRKALGEDHPNTIRALRHYAKTLDLLDRVHEAEPLYEQALEQRRRVLGEDHWRTLESRNDFAEFLYRRGQARKADRLFKLHDGEMLVPPITELRAAIGESKTVDFRVQSVGGERYRYLNSKSDFKNEDCFTAVVEPAQLTAFTAMFPKPMEQLAGKIVRVTGKIEERDGLIEIRVIDLAAQLKLLDAPRSAKPEEKR